MNLWQASFRSFGILVEATEGSDLFGRNLLFVLPGL